MEHFISLLLLPLVSAYNEILEIDQESSGFYGQHLVVALTMVEDMSYLPPCFN